MEQISPEQTLDDILHTLSGKKSSKTTIPLSSPIEKAMDESVFLTTVTDEKTGLTTPIARIHRWERDDLWRTLKARSLDIDIFTLTGYLKRLGRDEYATINSASTKGGDSMAAEITPEGLIFLRSGGYVAQQKKKALREAKEESIVDMQVKAADKSAKAAGYTVWLTVIIAILTAANIWVTYQGNKDDFSTNSTEIHKTQLQVQELQRQIKGIKAQLFTTPVDTTNKAPL